MNTKIPDGLFTYYGDATWLYNHNKGWSAWFINRLDSMYLTSMGQGWDLDKELKEFIVPIEFIV